MMSQVLKFSSWHGTHTHTQNGNLPFFSIRLKDWAVCWGFRVQRGAKKSSSGPILLDWCKVLCQCIGRKKVTVGNRDEGGYRHFWWLGHWKNCWWKLSTVLYTPLGMTIFNFQLLNNFQLNKKSKWCFFF